MRSDDMEAQKTIQKNGQINIVLKNNQVITNDQVADNNKKTGIKNPFSHIDDDLASFVGLNKLKQTVKEIYAAHVMNKMRQNKGLVSTDQVLHMLFKGNPGTGKTTVARQLAKAYFNMNILSKGHFIEAERADLVGEYIGQTAQKTRALIQKSMGGVLFIDEAYSLARGGEKDFGKEAIDTLVTHMENKQNDFVLILAGYPYEMERFLSINPGLKSRFPFIITFDDYSTDQLIKIAGQMAAKRDYQLTKDAEWKLRTHLHQQQQKTLHHFSNARYVRNMIEYAIRRHAVRLLYKREPSTDDLIYLKEEDFIIQKE